MRLHDGGGLGVSVKAIADSKGPKSIGVAFAIGQMIDNAQRQIQRQMVLHKGFQAASNLIAEATKLGQMSTASGFYPRALLAFVPKHYFTALFNATVFYFRFLATYTTGTAAQERIAIGSIIEAHKIFQPFPSQ